MATRYVNFIVDAENVSPQGIMWGGVQHENNATAVKYQLDESYLSSLGTDLKFRIDFSSSGAGYDPSENLELDSENCISRSIPQKFTQYAGEMNSTLVIVRDNAEIVQIPACIFFSFAPRKDEKLIESISAYEEHLARLASQTSESAGIAQDVLTTFYEKMNEVEYNHSDLVKKTEFADNSGNGGIIRLKAGYGISSGRYSGTSPQTGDTAIIVTASNGEINSRTNKFKPITPSNIEYAVKVALTDPKSTWTEEEKAAVRALLGV